MTGPAECPPCAAAAPAASDTIAAGRTAAPPRPIRVTYLITDLKVGGVPLHLYRLATSLPAERFQVRVISLAEEGPVGIRLRRAGVPVLGCGARSPADVRALWRLWRILRADPPDLLHALLFHANTAARVVGPAAGIPPGRILCEIQTVERERPWHLAVDNLTCRLCRLEIGNSPSVIDHLWRRAHIPGRRLRLMWGAVDLQAIAAAEPTPRASVGVSPDDALVLWTGRLDPVKGFEQMIPAIAAVARRRPVKFLLAGEGEYRPAVERLTREHELVDRVVLLGQRSDISGLLKAADVFLFCSMTEGLPNAVLEAMAAGLPIVATDVPGCRDLIRHGQTGLLVPYADVSATADAVLALLDSPMQASRLGSAAKSWVSERADLNRLPTRWERLYAEVMAEAPSQPIAAGDCPPPR